MSERKRDVGARSNPGKQRVSYRKLLEGYHAIIFVIQDYPDPAIPNLRTPLNDGRNLADLLVSHCGFSPAKIDVCAGSDATWDGIDERLRGRISRLAHDDSLFVYFAGHGEADETTRESYWLPHDAQKNNRRTWYSHDRLYRTIAEYKARHVAVVSDSCFSGRLLRSASEIEQGTKDKKWLTDAVKRRSRMALTSGGDHPVSDEGAAGLSIFNLKFTEFIRTTDKKAFSLGQLAYAIQTQIPNQRVCYGPLPDEAHDQGELVLFRTNRPSATHQKSNRVNAEAKESSTVKRSKLDDEIHGGLSFSISTEDNAFPLKDYPSQSVPLGEKGSNTIGKSDSELQPSDVSESTLPDTSQTAQKQASAGIWSRIVTIKNIKELLQVALGWGVLIALFVYVPKFGPVGFAIDRGFAWVGYPTSQYNMGVRYRDGMWVEEDYLEAVRWFRMAAEKGHASAQINLGVMYQQGHGVKEDDVEAVEWYLKSAEQGDALGEYNLGVMYSNGEGVEKNPLEAVRWTEKAAEQGLAKAQHNLGVMYAFGKGIAKDNDEAARWYKKAADQGFAEAQYNLGVMYSKGIGVKRNDLVAIKWYRKAAKQQHASAHYGLGAKYANGEGVPKDTKLAIEWFRKAAELGDEDADAAIRQLQEN